MIEYALREIAANGSDPEWWRGRVQERIVKPTHVAVDRRLQRGVDVMDEDWDTLIVLDACRADLFEECIDTDAFDEYRRTRSVGSATPEWTEKTFAGNRFGDTVYVTSNPFTSRIAGDSFHELVEVWKEAFDEELGTIPPEPVVEAARHALEEYPNKRVIVHVMQPHYPFIGEDRTGAGNAVLSPSDIVGDGVRTEKRTPWNVLRDGNIDHESVWRSYASNLDRALEAIDELLVDRELTGRTVVTADHGNALGERTWPVPIRLWGHPPYLRSGPLVTVPWAVVDDGTRREIVDEGITSVDETDDETLNERLRALGYAE